MSWRKQNSHREETQAVKDALRAAGIRFKSVGHGNGTAWCWLKINLGQNPSGMEHIKDVDTPWLCAGSCPSCERDREIRQRVIDIAKEVTGRHGDYDGEINVFMQ